MKASEFLKHHQERKQHELEEDEEKEHSLQENAKERAKNPRTLNAGTAFDWEELDGYQKELERLDREGPGTHQD